MLVLFLSGVYTEGIISFILYCMKLIDLPLWQSALVALFGSVLANLIVLFCTQPLAPHFKSLSVIPVTFWTLIAVVGATAVFALVRKYAQNPNPLFVHISWGALALSFFMDIPLFFFDIPFFAGATTAGIWALMVMHVVVAGITVPTLVRLTKTAIPR